MNQIQIDTPNTFTSFFFFKKIYISKYQTIKLTYLLKKLADPSVYRVLNLSRLLIYFGVLKNCLNLLLTVNIYGIYKKVISINGIISFLHLHASICYFGVCQLGFKKILKKKFQFIV